MAIYFGNDKIKEIYVGSDKIERVYHGSEKVWDGRGYWVHKDTGVKTYFGLDDSSVIADGIMHYPLWGSYCSEVKIPSGVTGLGTDCFYGSTLTSITLPEGVTSLGNFCFYQCTSLTSITLPESITSIGEYCFSGTPLTSITLPEGVTSIGNRCFINCTSLTLITVLPATPPFLGPQVFNNIHTSFNIKVRSPYVNAYKTDTNWSIYSSRISAI